MKTRIWNWWSTYEKLTMAVVVSIVDWYYIDYAFNAPANNRRLALIQPLFPHHLTKDKTSLRTYERKVIPALANLQSLLTSTIWPRKCKNASSAIFIRESPLRRLKQGEFDRLRVVRISNHRLVEDLRFAVSSNFKSCKAVSTIEPCDEECIRINSLIMNRG